VLVIVFLVIAYVVTQELREHRRRQDGRDKDS
jgi:hypothetical protein